MMITARTHEAKGPAKTSESIYQQGPGWKSKRREHAAIRAKTDKVELDCHPDILNAPHFDPSIIIDNWEELIAPSGILAESRAQGAKLDARKKSSARRALQAWYVNKVKETHGLSRARELGYAPSSAMETD
jgi:hypothetical protein